MGLNYIANPRFIALDPTTGFPAAGGFVYTVQPGTTVQFGSAPAYPQVTYTDYTGSTPNNNPIILDSNGQCDIWTGTYLDIWVYNSSGVLIKTLYNLSSQPLIQATNLQFVLQTSQASYLSATSFTVPNNALSTYTSGTVIQALFNGITIYGQCTGSSFSVGSNTTTVNVAWYSTTLSYSSSLTISTGIITGGIPNALPVMPVIPITSTPFTASVTCMGQIFTVSVASATFNLPAANALPSGWSCRIKNIGATMYLGNAIDGNSANTATLGQYNEIVPFTDGAAWWGRRI